MLDTSIEGGDVIIDGDTVYVGISQRTDMSAIGQLEEALPEYTVIPVQPHEKFCIWTAYLTSYLKAKH